MLLIIPYPAIPLLDQTSSLQLKRAKLELPANGNTIPAGTAIAINQANNGLVFEGATDINLGSSAAEFASRYPVNIEIYIAGQLADETDLTWASPQSFSWANDIWPTPNGTEIIIEETP